MSEADILQQALADAVACGDVTRMEDLLAQGADPHRTVPLSPGFDYLSNAVLSGEPDSVRVLLNRGVEVNRRNEAGKTPMHALAANPDEGILRQLLDAGARCDIADSEGRTALALLEGALDKGRAEEAAACLDAIMEYGRLPRINPSTQPETLKERLFREHNGATPLDNPEVWQNFDAVGKALIGQGQPITKQEMLEMGNDGESLIDKAARFRQLEPALAHLREQGDRLTVRDLCDNPRLLTNLCHYGGEQALFSFEQLKEDGVPGLQALRRAVDESALQMVPNLFALRAQLDSAHQQDTALGR